MDRLIQVDHERLAVELREELEGLLGQVMNAVNAARDGRLIADSERPVLELMRDFQKRVNRLLKQMRVDSTESAFSPSQGPGGKGQAHRNCVAWTRPKRWPENCGRSFKQAHYPCSPLKTLRTAELLR